MSKEKKIHIPYKNIYCSSDKSKCYKSKQTQHYLKKVYVYHI